MQSDRLKTKRRSQLDRREESGRKLVQAAVALIAEGGINAATFQAIGARSGYSASLVTERFGARRGLIDAIIAYLQDDLDQLLQQVERKRLSGLDALLRYIDLWLVEMAHNSERRAYVMLLSSFVSDPSDIRAVFAAGHERVRLRLAALVRRGQQDGSFRPEFDSNAASLFVGSLQLGLSMQLLVDPSTRIEPLGGTIIDILRQSFAAR